MPLPGRRTAPAPGRTAARATAAGLAPASLACPTRQQAPRSPVDQVAAPPADLTAHRVSPAPATGDQTAACPWAGPAARRPGRGTAHRRAVRRTRHHRKAASPAVRRPDRRSAGTRSNSTRDRRAPARLALAPGSPEIRGRDTVPRLTVTASPRLTATASRARAPAVSPAPPSVRAQALRRVRAFPGRGVTRAGGRPGTRHRRPASSSAPLGRDRVPPAAPTTRARRRRVSSPLASRRPRPDRCRPATSLRLISSFRPASSRAARRSPVSLPPAGRLPARRAPPPGSIPPDQLASRQTRGQGRAARPATILTGC
jgi:hypothetical protein